jgi:predicted DCC family thiol-disulfide oxidoreductase YuxK
MKRYIVIYDDGCAFCAAAVAHIRRLDRLGIVEIAPLSHPCLPVGVECPLPSELARSLILFTPEGEKYVGSEAVALLAFILPATRWLGYVLLLPGIKQIARPIYRFIARHRMRLAHRSSMGE